MMKNKLAMFAAGAVALLILPLFAQYFGNGWVRILDSALLYMMLALGLFYGLRFRPGRNG